MKFLECRSTGIRKRKYVFFSKVFFLLTAIVVTILMYLVYSTLLLQPSNPTFAFRIFFYLSSETIFRLVEL